MEKKLSSHAKSSTSSPIQQLSHLAQRCNAINLAKGFPDFAAPSYIKEAAVFAINSDFNRYRHVQRLCDHVAKNVKVYEYITYDNERHISVASLPRMKERTIITSSMSKTYCVTGWRIGWAIAPAFTADAIRNIHIRLTDSAPAPFQEAALTALQSSSEYYESVKEDYESKRDFIIKFLRAIGFHVEFKPQGSFFVFAELPKDYEHSDINFVEELIKEAGVVAVLGCGFFHTKLPRDDYQNRYIRFAFCKSTRTLTTAVDRINELLDSSSGHLKLFVGAKDIESASVTTS